VKKVLLVFGTRPEAIKMAPLVAEFQKHSKKFELRVCVTAQHRGMLDQVLDFFSIKPDYDLDLMKHNQNLYDLTGDVVSGLKNVLEDCKPDYVFVHGDTTTSMAAALAGFYFGAKVCHIEAGLRTGNKYSPFPEEMNRAITGRLTDYHFSPTTTSRDNLLKENVNENTICITGNTVIDALLQALHIVETRSFESIKALENIVTPGRKMILVTGHRRENHGEGFERLCRVLGRLATEFDLDIVYPVHKNPNVLTPVTEYLGNIPNIHLIEPQPYEAFVWLMKQSYLIITDSGGVQEEAPSLGKPVLVTRNTTERPEAVDAGTVLLVGTDEERIYSETKMLLDDTQRYEDMCKLHNPYGDGLASQRVLEFLLNLS
jgi:UDP-N-acetylglucosamine 2-epimerase (non-hydrolysing)